MGRPRKFDSCEVLDHAMRVFWTQGYDGASMARLTAAMDMNAPSIYFAFGSKRGLFDAVLERYDRRRAAHAELILAATTAREATERLLYGAIDWLTAEDEPLGCLMVQSGLSAGGDNAEVPMELARRRQRVTALLTERYERGQREGDLTVALEPGELARYFQVIFDGLCVQAGVGVPREQLQRSAAMALKAWPA